MIEEAVAPLDAYATAKPDETRKIYLVWVSMRQRCNNPRNHKYSIYGARGIAVCERWSSFDNFLADMGPRPTPQHQFERKNNDGNYTPENCCWATRREQVENRSNSITVRFRGEIVSLAEVSRRTGVKYGTLYMRWWRNDETFEQALERGYVRAV